MEISIYKSAESKRAFSIIEMTIAILIGAIVIYASSRLLIGGLESFRKSSSSLSLTQAVAILLENIGADIRCSQAFQADQGNLQLDTITWNGYKVVNERIDYFVAPNRLCVERETADGRHHAFCRGFKIQRLTFSKPLGEKGILVEWEVSVPPLDRESLHGKRFYFAETHPANAPAGFKY